MFFHLLAANGVMNRVDKSAQSNNVVQEIPISLIDGPFWCIYGIIGIFGGIIDNFRGIIQFFDGIIADFRGIHSNFRGIGKINKQENGYMPSNIYNKQRKD